MIRKSNIEKAKKYLKQAEQSGLAGDTKSAHKYLDKAIQTGVLLEYAWYGKSKIADTVEERISFLQKAIYENPADEQFRDLLQEELSEQKTEYLLIKKREEEKIKKEEMRLSAEPSLRRSTFIGQESIVKNVQICISQAVEKDEALEHMLFTGPEGMGKVTLGNLIADEIGVNIRRENALDMDRAGDLAAILTNLESKDILLIENLDHLKERTVSILAESLSDYALRLTIGKGPSARSLRLQLPRFTLIGTTTRPSQMNHSLLRWMSVYDFMPYDELEMSEILKLLARRNGIEVDSQSRLILASYSEGNPDHAKALITRIGDECTSPEATKNALKIRGYSEKSRSSWKQALNLMEMGGQEFEEYVASIYREEGYLVEVTGKAGDHGIDLIMKRPGETIAVQCKRWTEPVGEAVIRDFYGALLHAGISIGWVIATSSFTANALDFVQGKPIRLVDMDGLLQVIISQRGD